MLAKTLLVMGRDPPADRGQRQAQQALSNQIRALTCHVASALAATPRLQLNHWLAADVSMQQYQYRIRSEVKGSESN
jgi:hypothetical protein